ELVRQGKITKTAVHCCYLVLSPFGSVVASFVASESFLMVMEASYHDAGAEAPTATNGASSPAHSTRSLKKSQPEPVSRQSETDENDDDGVGSTTTATKEEEAARERRLRLKIDLRLCTIAGILCSLNLLDSGVISSASVTSMLEDLDLTGNRYSVSIFIFTIASIAFQLPSTIAVRTVGPRPWFAFITLAFGLITLCTAFVQTWRQMIALRVLLGMAMSGVYPGLTYLISTWYRRDEQQTRYAFLQSGEVIVLATGGIVNYAVNKNLGGRAGLAGWRWMFLVQGLISCVLGIVTYFWIVDFPENAHRSLWFLTADEQELAVRRIQDDRRDVEADPFAWRKVLRHAADPKVYGFAVLFFCLTSVIPVLLSSIVADRLRLRGPVIIFNCLCLVAGFGMLGFAEQVTVRYVGTYLATGAYISNWAALSSYQANNIAGQWKRVFTAAAVTACNGAGGIAGSFIVRQPEAPRYMTAVWVSIGSHIVIIAVVGVFSLYFYRANSRQKRGRVVLEGTEGFRYTY
ncbi:hypothetical protein PG995_013327, partial [Apiospora arundinis]